MEVQCSLQISKCQKAGFTLGGKYGIIIIFFNVLSFPEEVFSQGNETIIFVGR